jgi:hypothetical protein
VWKKFDKGQKAAAPAEDGFQEFLPRAGEAWGRGKESINVPAVVS